MRRRSQGFTLIEIMVVIAIIAGLVATVAVVIPTVQERNKRLQCAGNLKQLGDLFMIQRMDRGGKPKYSGVSLWLAMRKGGGGMIRKQDEKVLTCPGDMGVVVPDTPDAIARYDEVDLANPPDDLCSYAARDFTAYPMSANSTMAEIIGCDRNGADGRQQHHRGGINIYLDNNSCDFYENDELGLSSDEEIVVGPDSNQEWLKKVIYLPTRSGGKE